MAVALPPAARTAIGITLGLILALLVYGAIPFVMLPSMGQVVWTTSFAQSIANQSLQTLTANNFGLPAPAPIAFGLAGVYPTAIFIKLGFAPPDAYALMATLWLVGAFTGAFLLANRFAITKGASALLATTWLCLPIVWLHASYSMLSLGIALLPAYFYTAFVLLGIGKDTVSHLRAGVPLLIASALVAVFMDGYTFVMFAAGTLLFTAYMWLVAPKKRKQIAMAIVPVEILAFGLAYVAYTRYFPGSDTLLSPSDVFRSMGLDLSFLLVPSKGISWVFDTLHLSVERTIDHWYGDPSLWETTFLLPLVLLSLTAWLALRKRFTLAHAALILALGSTYLSLGPSIKAWSEKPVASAQVSYSMPADAALLPTGTEALSSHMPGLKSMRASYRWLALGAFGFWLLVVLLHAAPLTAKQRHGVTIATMVVLLLSLPSPRERIQDTLSYRAMFSRMERELLASFQQHVRPGETVAFLPHGNDFLAGYLAARTGAFTYNVGGDKNNMVAAAQWPAIMRDVPSGVLPPDMIQRAFELLLNGDIHAVAVPNFSEPYASNYWPCLKDTAEKFSLRVRQDALPVWGCPAELAAQYASVLAHAPPTENVLTVTSDRWLSVIRLMPSLASEEARKARLREVLNEYFPYPIQLNQPQPHLQWLLPAGWYAKEDTHIWSAQDARVQLPIPARCSSEKCTAILHFAVYGAEKNHAIHVKASSLEGPAWTEVTQVLDDQPTSLRVPLPPNLPLYKLDINVEGATSPSARTGAPDSRVLGLALISVDLESTSK